MVGGVCACRTHDTEGQLGTPFGIKYSFSWVLAFNQPLFCPSSGPTPLFHLLTTGCLGKNLHLNPDSVPALKKEKRRERKKNRRGSFSDNRYVKSVPLSFTFSLWQRSKMVEIMTCISIKDVKTFLNLQMCLLQGRIHKIIKMLLFAGVLWCSTGLLFTTPSLLRTVPTPSASFNPGVHPTPPSPHPGLENQDLYFSKIHSQVACTLKLMKPSIFRRPYKIEKGRVIIFILQMGQSRHREMNLSDQGHPAGSMLDWSLDGNCWFSIISHWYPLTCLMLSDQTACFSLETTVLTGCTLVWVTLFGGCHEKPWEGHKCGSMIRAGVGSEGRGKENEWGTAWKSRGGWKGEMKQRQRHFKSLALLPPSLPASKRSVLWRSLRKAVGRQPRSWLEHSLQCSQLGRETGGCLAYLPGAPQSINTTCARGDTALKQTTLARLQSWL